MSNASQQHNFIVPMDMYMDIMRILLFNKIPNQVKGLNERENSINLYTENTHNNGLYDNALKNIVELLDRYNYYRKGRINEDWEG